MRTAFLPVIAAALFLTAAAPARATDGRLKVAFDCYLKTTVACATLSSSFFAAVSGIESSDASSSDVVIKVRAWILVPYEQYELGFSGAAVAGGYKLRNEELKVRNSVSSQGKTVLLVDQLVKGLAPFLPISEHHLDRAGALAMTFGRGGEKAVATSVPAASPSAVGPWAATGKAGGKLTDMRVISDSLWLSGEGAYETPQWYVSLNLGNTFVYTYISTPSGALIGKEFQATADQVTSRSISNHWSVALVPRAAHVPSSNWRVRGQLHAGIEYEQNQFLPSNDNTFTASYLVGGGYDQYYYVNAQGQNAAAFWTHAIAFNFVRHLQRFDLSAGAGVTAFVNDPDRYAFGGTFATKVYLSDSFSLDAYGSVGRKRNLINAPGDPNAVSPVLASAAVPLTLDATFNISYVWGNTLQRQRDTRWQNSATTLPINF